MSPLTLVDDRPPVIIIITFNSSAVLGTFTHTTPRRNVAFSICSSFSLALALWIYTTDGNKLKNLLKSNNNNKQQKLGECLYPEIQHPPLSRYISRGRETASSARTMNSWFGPMPPRTSTRRDPWLQHHLTQGVASRTTHHVCGSTTVR